MRWRKKVLQNGATRTIKKFAWFPISYRDGTIIWLEFYLEHQYYFGYWRVKSHELINKNITK